MNEENSRQLRMRKFMKRHETVEILSMPQRRNEDKSLRESNVDGHVKMPPRDLMLFAIFRIFPRRSLELTFLGDVDKRFLMFAGPLADCAAPLTDGDVVGAEVVLDFFRWEFDGVETRGRTWGLSQESRFVLLSALIFFVVF